MNNHMKNLVVWAIIFVLMVVLFNLFNQPPMPQDQPSYSEFLSMVESGGVAEVKTVSYTHLTLPTKRIV